MTTLLKFKDCEIGNIAVNNGGKPQCGLGTITTDGPTSAEPPVNNFCYPEGQIPKVLIISNDYSGSDLALPGYKIDAEKLDKMWEEFGCDVTLHPNATCKQMRKYIRNFAARILTGKEKFCVIIILSHGGYEKDYGEYVLGSDEGKEGCIPVDHILAEFSNVRNTTLHGMPKVFIFQCCRGHNKPQGVSKGATAAGASDNKLPQISDTLVMYATQPNDVAIVDEDGSWLIKAVLEVFKQHWKSEHFADMLTMVNRLVAEKIVSKSTDPELVGVKCMSEIKSTLRYKLMINCQQQQ